MTLLAVWPCFSKICFTFFFMFILVLLSQIYYHLLWIYLLFLGCTWSKFQISSIYHGSGNDHEPKILLHLLVFGLIFDDFAAFFAGFRVLCWTCHLMKIGEFASPTMKFTASLKKKTWKTHCPCSSDRPIDRLKLCSDLAHIICALVSIQLYFRLCNGVCLSQIHLLCYSVQ